MTAYAITISTGQPVDYHPVCGWDTLHATLDEAEALAARASANPGWSARVIRVSDANADALGWSARSEAQRAAAALRDTRPGPIVVRTGAATLTLSIDSEGHLCTQGRSEGKDEAIEPATSVAVSAWRQWPEGLEHATSLRLALLLARAPVTLGRTARLARLSRQQLDEFVGAGWRQWADLLGPALASGTLP